MKLISNFRLNNRVSSLTYKSFYLILSKDKLRLFGFVDEADQK